MQELLYNKREFIYNMTAIELRELSNEELVKKEEELRASIFKGRFNSVLGDSGDATKAKELRQDIARIKTILRQRKLEN